MSGHRYVSNPNSLFEEDEIDDETFLRNSVRSPTTGGGTNPFASDIEQQRQMFEQKRKEIENRTLESSNRSIGLLRETEQVGVATAEELARQREQLENTSRQLDEINSTLRFSQKHLNGLKSLFGGLKNYMSGKNDLPPSRMTSSPSGSKISINSSSTLNQNMNPEDSYNSHPVNRFREEHISQGMNHNMSGGPGTFNEQLDRNLDEMAGSLSRLKGLALDLNVEIDGQNDLLDNITTKVEDVDVKLGKQNKDINRLLGKK